MGRFVKNLKLHAASYAIGVPTGTSSLGPDLPIEGQIRLNVDLNNDGGGIEKLQAWYNGKWNNMTQDGRVAIRFDTFTGDGVQGAGTSTFLMTQGYVPTAREIAMGVTMEPMILVFIGNVFQSPVTAYTINDRFITFTSVPDEGMPILVLHNYNSTRAVQ